MNERQLWNMATLVSISTGELHRITAVLAHAAGDRGDDFLKYLFVMALRHIEETALDPADDARAAQVGDATAVKAPAKG